MLKHILNIVALSQSVEKTDDKPKFYYHLNQLFKGVRGQLSKDELQKVKKTLIAEHKKNLAFIDKEIDYVKSAEVKQAS